MRSDLSWRAVAIFFLSPMLFAAEVQHGTGKIVGRITNPERCTGIAAIQRGGTMTRLKIASFPGQLDKRTGEFVIPNLAEGRYDLRVLVPGGQIDGADMKLDHSQQHDEPLTEKDRQAILEKIANYPERYDDILRPIYIEGNHKFAKVLVECIRYRPFHSGGPNARSWRVEIWIYEYHYGGWVKKQHGWVVLARVRSPLEMPREQFDNLVWLFDPKLGGVEVAEGKVARLPDYTVPDKFEMSMGKIPGSVEKQAEEHRKTKGGPAEY